MDKKKFEEAVKKLRNPDYKKNFKQTVDLSVNLKNLNLKKPEDKVDVYMQLPNGKGKKSNVCIFVDEAMVTEAKKVFENVIEKEKFPILAKNKKELKKLASKCDFFVSQANLMPEVAKNFGRVLGQIGKMPNPKAGCVIPPKAALKPLLERLQNTVRLQTKNELAVKCPIGTEEMDDNKLVENAKAIYDNLVRALPQGENNVKTAFLKLTMSPAVKIGEENGKA